MNMRVDLVWHDDGSLEYQASCAKCRYVSLPVADEEAARAAWFGHVCVWDRVPAAASAVSGN
jgi:hypothetical protein